LPLQQQKKNGKPEKWFAVFIFLLNMQLVYFKQIKGEYTTFTPKYSCKNTQKR